MNKFVRLTLAIALCEGAGLIGSIFTFSAIPTWYATLNKPIFAPPNYVFGPVWVTLYLLMGVSLFLVWEKKKKDLRWFYIQLILNVLWSIIFFGLKNLPLSLFVIVALWISIFMTIRTFFKIDTYASYLLVPYLFWVTFASFLNLGIVLINTSGN